MFLTSCSSSDDTNDISSDILVRRTVKTYPYDVAAEVTNYTYNGMKMLRSSTSSGDEYAIYTYTGDLLTQVKRYHSFNVLWETETFTYNSDNKLTQYLQQDWHIHFSDRKAYVYNSDGTVSVTSYFGDTVSELYEARNEIIYFSGEEVSALEMYQVGTGTLEDIILYTHDTKNHPFKNVTGFDVFALINADSFSVSHNLLSSNWETIGSMDNREYTSTYLYNSLNYPLTSVTTEDSNHNSDITMQYTYY